MSTSRSPRLLIVLCLAALSLLMASCGSDASIAAGSGSEPDNSDGSSPSSSEARSYDGDWTLIDGDIAGVSFTPVEGYPITLEIAGEEIRGNAGCNSFGGQFTADGTSLNLGDVSITEMACADQGPMEAEQTFIQAFWQATAIEHTGSGADERLVLSGAAGTLNYAKVAPTPTAELVGTVWILDTFVQGEAASSTIAGVDEATLFLGDDGRFLTLTGCRELTGPYTLDGDRLTLLIEMEDYACEGPAGEQEPMILTVLEQPMTAAIDEQRLTLTADDGRSGLSFRAEK